MVFQKITHFRQSSLLFCNSELSSGVYTLKKISISIFHRQIYCWMGNCFPAFIFSVIGNFEERWKIGFCTTIFCKASWDLQLSRAPSSCPDPVPTVVESTNSCQEYLKNRQLSGLPTAVESIFSCQEHLQLSKVPPAVETRGALYS